MMNCNIWIGNRIKINPTWYEEKVGSHLPTFVLSINLHIIDCYITS